MKLLNEKFQIKRIIMELKLLLSILIIIQIILQIYKYLKKIIEKKKMIHLFMRYTTHLKIKYLMNQIKIFMKNIIIIIVMIL